MKNSKGQIIVSKHPWDYDVGSVYIMFVATLREINALFHENFKGSNLRSS